MARLPAVQENTGVGAMFPSTPLVQAISASNGTSTLTVANVSDSYRILLGMVVTGTGISGSPSLVTAVNNSTGVITIAGGTQSGMTAGNYTFTPSFYLALFTSDPTTVGTSGEVTGGSYARQPITFGVPSSGVVTSTDAQNFTNMPVEAGGCPYFAIFGTLTGTTAYLGGGATSGLSGAISAGSTVAVAIGGVTWTQS
jgi:hypothetical protein